MAPVSDVVRKHLETYLKHLGTERRLSPHTSSNYARDLRALADFMERGNLAALEHRSTASTCACSPRAHMPAA